MDFTPWPRPQTQAERVAESAARLQEALAALITEQGYLRTSAAEISERAGYSRSMVRDRYGSKDALLLALHDDYERHLVGPELPETGLHAVLAGVERLRTFAEEHPARLQALFIVSFEAIGAVEVMRPRVVKWINTLEAVYATWLEQGRANGSVRPDVDPPTEAIRMLNEALAGAYRWILIPTTDYDRHLRNWSQALQDRFIPKP